MQTTDDIKGVPPKIEVVRGGRALTVSGFVPNAALRDVILTRLAQEVPQAVVRNQLAVLPKNPADLEAAFAQWQRDTEQWHRESEQMRRDADQQRQQASAAAIAKSLSRVRQRLEPLRAAVMRQQQTAGASASAPLTELRGALDAAIEKSTAAIATPSADQNQLLPLWQALARADELLTLAMGNLAPQQRGKEQSPPASQDLAEEASLLAERLSAVGLGLPIPATVTALNSQVARLRPPTPREELETLIRSTAIFFDNGSDLKDPKLAATLLDDLAKRLRAGPDVLVRVVGYTDDRGGQSVNNGLAQNPCGSHHNLVDRARRPSKPAGRHWPPLCQRHLPNHRRRQPKSPCRIRTGLSGRAERDAMMMRKKLVLLGEMAVGKTSIVRRLVLDRFEGDYKGTLGHDIFVYSLTELGPARDQSLELVIWDTDGGLGASAFHLDAAVRGASAVIIVGDVTRPRTLGTMAILTRECDKQLPRPPPVSCVE